MYSALDAPQNSIWMSLRRPIETVVMGLLGSCVWALFVMGVICLAVDDGVELVRLDRYADQQWK
jgi:hypothetical protein